MAEPPACIWVLAGTNGAGKSSIGGAFLRHSGGDYFNPDEAARRMIAAHPDMTQADANGTAWQEGLRQLDAAIRERREHFFETTLGGETITARLERARDAGLELRIWYVGLASLELHLARIAARVKKGGHDIPEADVRRRFRNSRLNLIRLLPRLTELQIYADNSIEADPGRNATPEPKLVLHLERGRIAGPADLGGTPDWARPIVAAAMKLPAAWPNAGTVVP